MTSNSETHNRGTNVALRRLLSSIGATSLLVLGLGVGSASATTVYDYVYSGSYIDGSSSGQTFKSGLGGVAYNRHTDEVLAAVGGSPGTVGKFNLSGAALNFSALGSPLFSIEPSLGTPDIAIDQSEGPTEGRFYVTGSNFAVRDYSPDGTPLPKTNWQQVSPEDLCGIGVSPNGQVVHLALRDGLAHYTPEGEPISTDYVGPPGFQPGVKLRAGERNRPCNLVVDNNGDIYGVKQGFGFGSGGPAVKMSPSGLEYYELNHREDSQGVAVDYANNDVFVLNSSYEGGSFELFDEKGRRLGAGWGGPDAGHSYEGITRDAYGIFVDPATHDVWIANHREYEGGAAHLEKFTPTNPHVIPDTTATPAGYIDPEGEHMQLRGTVNAGGVETTDCQFEYGTTEELGLSVPCVQGSSYTGTEDHVVTAEIGTEKGSRYFYRLSARNGNEQVAPSNLENFIPQGKPVVPGFLAVDRVNTDGVRFSTEFDPNGGNASFHFEWGEKGNGFEESSAESKTYGFLSSPGLFNGENKYVPGIQHVFEEVEGLKPGTTYEYRAVVTNEAGTVDTPTQDFTSYTPDSGIDRCQNAEIRRQSEGSLLPDCRGYELVSAANQGGYDVESTLVPGQSPLDAYPQAEGRLLYSMHFGVLPGVAGSPTNDGLDPYLAIRGNEGWTTTYVGLPANGMADAGAFGSPLLGADAGLETFAFGGKKVCEPCFADGSTNVPLRRPDGTLEEGMAGSLNPAGEPTGEVRQPLSEDGSHFVFGSEQPYESVGNNGSVSIYERDLNTNTTQVVSTMPNGSTMTGEVAELDVSNDGSRVLVGKVVGEDAAGNKLYDLYMHVGNSADSIQVADAPSGVIFDGMTGDGGMVYFTTTDQLAGDTDHSADLFRTEVGSTSPAPISRVSTGSEGTGNTDSCEPVVNWNVASGGPNCSVVAVAGGGGVARDDGTVYFISPEKLDGAGNGTENQPNLYVERPGGSPHYVGEIDSSIGKPPPQPPAHPVVSTNFVTGLSQPEGLAVDQETGAIYVAETGAGRISRFDSSGAPLKFPEGPGAGTNHIPDSGMYSTESEIAVDSSGGVLDGTIYAMQGYGAVAAYDRNGKLLGELTGFGEACGVAVNQHTGELFVGDWSFGGIHRFTPTSAATPLSNANYTETSIHTQGQNPCHVGADTAGHAFAVSWSSGPLTSYNVSDFAASPETKAGVQIAGTSRALSSDPVTGDLYNDEGNKIVVYDSAGNEIETIGSSESLGSTSNGVAVNGSTKDTYALNGSNIVKFGYEVVPYEPVDNPAVKHGVQQAGVHDFEDFQVTPDGRYAVFSSPVALTGYQNLGHYEIYRYDAENEELVCASCAPTNAVGQSSVKLAPHGLNLADDGRVFFTTRESLNLRDTDEKTDAYEWNDGKVSLISAGIGQDNSALLTASADGKDVFFYTRDVLIPTDHNGNVVKIYDAREGGGFLYDPPRGLCKASDECHGPGTETPPPPSINTTTGPEKARPPVTSTAKKCRKGKVLRNGHCVKKSHAKKCRKGKVLRNGHCVKKSHVKRHRRHSTGRHG